MRVAELVERHRITGIDRELTFAERDSLVQPSSEERHLPQEVVRARNPRILLQRPFQFGLRQRFHLQADHHLRRQQVRGRRFRVDLEGARERVPRCVGLAVLDVSHAEDVRQLEVVGRPPARLFEQRNRVREAPGQVIATGPRPAPPRVARPIPAAAYRARRTAARWRPGSCRRDSARSRADTRLRARSRRGLEAPQWHLGGLPLSISPRAATSAAFTSS